MPTLLLDYTTFVEKISSKMEMISKYKLSLIGLILGAISGYLYYYFVGCAGGTCSITSDPLNSSLYGAMMGGLLFHSFGKEEVKKEP